MKFECIKEKLKAAVVIAEKATGKNMSLPILSGLYLEAIPHKLILRATNLDIGLELEINAKIEVPGKVVVSASVLASFLSVAPDDERIKVELIGNNLSLSVKKNNTIIRTLPVEDFPSIPVVKGEETAVISGGDLVSGLRAVLPAAASSDIRPELGSVYVYSDSEYVYFVATDSFRLAEKKIKKDNPTSFSGVLLPARNALEVVRVFENTQDSVQIEFNKNQIVFIAEGASLVSRVVSGNFPNYKAIIPKEGKTKVLLSKKELLSALRGASLFTDKTGEVVLRLNPSEGLFEISGKKDDTGENTANLEASLEGEAVTMHFNSRYIMDAMAILSGDLVSLSFSGQGKPLVITSPKDTGFLYLAMPLAR